jgi:membrane-associated phospholipid phosphatase
MIPRIACRHRIWSSGAVLLAAHFAGICIPMLTGAQVPIARDSGVARDSAWYTAQIDSPTVVRRTATPLVTRGDAVAFAGAAVATLVLSPLDRPALGEFDTPRWRDSRRIRHAAGDVAFLGSDGPFLASALFYVGWPAGRASTLRRFAAHDMEAIALATALTGIAKGVTGRALPGVQVKHEFSLGRGFHDDNGPFVSFPSGHTAAAFALAATISGETARVDSGRAAFVEPIAFGLASAVGVARVVQRAHWPSDLPLGAVIGTWSGLVVQRHSVNRGRLDGLVRGLTVTPEGKGRAEVGWSSSASY